MLGGIHLGGLCRPEEDELVDKKHLCLRSGGVRKLLQDSLPSPFLKVPCARMRARTPVTTGLSLQR